ncbi:MAG: hypothetical protein KDE48_15395 [Anaerolineales bacterium]|nr:hypothetical protein [Anaerolineales bacterium]
MQNNLVSPKMGVWVAGGSGFEICLSNCVDGIPETDNGQFDEPIGIVATSDNNLFVLGEQYVQEFTPNGQFVAKWRRLHHGC